MGFSFACLFAGKCDTQTVNDNLTEQTNITQTSTDTCISQCSAVTDNNLVIINNSNINGDVTVSSTCNADLSCIINNNLDSNIQNIISAIVNQSQTTANGIFPTVSADSNSQTVNLQITNNITQVLASTCKAIDNVITNNNTIIVNNSNINGGFSVGAYGSANANCQLTNLAGIAVFNSEQVQQTQSQTTLSLLSILAIAAVVGIVFIIVVVIIVIFLNHSNVSKAATNTATTTTTAPIVLSSLPTTLSKAVPTTTTTPISTAVKTT